MFRKIIIAIAIVSYYIFVATVISHASVSVDVIPNQEGIVYKSKIVNIVIKLMDDNEIASDKVLVYWNGQDVTQEVIETAATHFNESKTEFIFYYPIFASELQHGIHSIAVTVGDGKWDQTEFIVSEYDNDSIAISLANSPATIEANTTYKSNSGSSITVSSPNGSESWKAGDKKDIKWSSSGLSGYIDIYYRRNNGSSWGEPIFSKKSNDGTESWTIPDMSCSKDSCNYEGTKKALIKISGNSLSSIYDVSDSTFTVSAKCQCVTYMKNTYGWESESTGHAKDMGSFLEKKGYKKSTDSNGKPKPVTGAIVIFGTAYKTTSGKTFDADHGHVAIVNSYSGPTTEKKKTKYTLNIKGANQGSSSVFTENACTNVKNSSTSYYVEDNNSSIAFYTK